MIHQHHVLFCLLYKPFLPILLFSSANHRPPLSLFRSFSRFIQESEKLQSFPSPPHVLRNHIRNERISMGESRGLLYICDTYSFHDVTMWVMNEYGIGESWTKVYNIDTSISSLGRPDMHCGLCWPLKHFEDGASMLLYHSCNCLIYYEPEKYGFKVFRIHGTDSQQVQIIPHTPSLISLKDVVKGDNIEVLNIYSMCANVKLREENEVLSLSQQLISTCSSSSSYDDLINVSSSSS